MAFSIFDLVLTGVEIILYTFHLSVLIMLFSKRKTTFRSTFYHILSIIIFVDLMNYFCTVIFLKLPTAGFFHDVYYSSFYTNNISYMGTNIPSYFGVVLFVGHTLTSFNRFTILWFPTYHRTIWAHWWYYIALLGLPFLHVCYRLHDPTIYQSAAFTATVYLISSIIYAVTTLLAATFSALSIYKFYFSKKLNSLQKIKGNEINLFFVSIAILAVQILRTLNLTGRSVFAENVELAAFLLKYLPLISDIYAWTSSFSLLLLSPSTRRTYFNYYGLSSKPSSVTTKVSFVGNARSSYNNFPPVQ